MFRLGLTKKYFGVSPDEMAFSRFRALGALRRAGFAEPRGRAVRLPPPGDPGGPLRRPRPPGPGARAGAAPARDHRLVRRQRTLAGLTPPAAPRVVTRGGVLTFARPMTDAPSPRPPDDPILEEVRRFYEEHHEGIERSRRRHRYYYDYLTRILRVRVPEGQRVLDLGCGAGHLLAALEPSDGVGIDVSAPAIRDASRAPRRAGACASSRATSRTPPCSRGRAGPSTSILLVNVVTHLTDVQAALEALHAVSHPRTRVLIYSYSRLWQPLLRLAELLGLKYEQPPESWLPPEEIKNMLSLADFEVVRDDAHLVCPVRVPLLADLVNRYVGRLPLLDELSLVFGIIARPAPSRTAAARPGEAHGERRHPLPQRGRPHPAPRRRACPPCPRARSSCSSRATPRTTRRR